MRRELGGGRGCNGRGRLRLPRTPFRPGRRPTIRTLRGLRGLRVRIGLCGLCVGIGRGGRVRGGRSAGRFHAFDRQGNAKDRAFRDGDFIKRGVKHFDGFAEFVSFCVSSLGKHNHEIGPRRAVMFREGHKPVQPGDFPDNRLQGVFHFLARQGDGPFVVERDFDPPVGVGGLRGCGADGKSVSIQSGHSDGCRRIEEEARGRNQKEDREAECKLARLQQRCHGEKDDDACRNPHDNPAWNEQRPISGSSRSRLPVGHQIRSHSQKRSAKKEKRDGRGHNGQNGQRDQDGMSARLFRCCGGFRVFGVFRGWIHRFFPIFADFADFA